MFTIRPQSRGICKLATLVALTTGCTPILASSCDTNADCHPLLRCVDGFCQADGEDSVSMDAALSDGASFRADGSITIDGARSTPSDSGERRDGTASSSDSNIVDSGRFDPLDAVITLADGAPDSDGDGVADSNDCAPSDSTVGAITTRACSEGCPIVGGMQNCTQGIWSECVCTPCLDGCKDQHDCTVDRCEGTSCSHTPDNARCGSGGTCNAESGCQYPTCTARTCVAEACQLAVCEGDVCQRTLLCASDQECCGGQCVSRGCDDGNPCTTDACRTDGCTHTPLGSGSPCTDDGNVCTSDVCDGSGVCTHPARTDQGCPDDGHACTNDVCNSAGTCTHPARTGASCADDGNICTNDVCNSAGACTHPPLANRTACGDYAVCCGGRCASLFAPDTCGSCEISCSPNRVCRRITNNFAETPGCACATRDECVAAGYGANATCVSGECRCNCSGSASSCTGQCRDGICVGARHYCYIEVLQP